MITKIIGGILAFFVLLIGLVVAFGSWGTLDAGYVGVVLKMGAVTGEIKPPGFYTKTPWIVHVQPMNIQIQKEQVETECSSHDLQLVKSTVSLNLSLMSDHAAKIYQDIGVGYLNTVVAPAMQESVKAIMAQYTAEELITKRELVRDGIANLISTKLGPVGIKTEAVNIVNFNFSPTFEQAIEAKVTAEQNALAAKNKLEQVKYEAEQAAARADGEAKAITIQAQAIQAQGGEAYIRLKALEKWDGKLPQIVGSGAIPFVNASVLDKTKTINN
jgi:regulator of protease activity HflC (stomatin/prohibitin superfamily)